MVENRRISLPPCWLAVEVKAEPTLPFFAQRPPARSVAHLQAPSAVNRVDDREASSHAALAFLAHHA
jgi:hypothetical protein